MPLLDRFLKHDAWTTRRLLEICAALDDEQLDREFDIGHKTLRATLDHIVRNVELWSTLMAGGEVERNKDRSVAGMISRVHVAHARLQTVARRVAEENAWDETWVDRLDDPPTEKSFGTSIAHVITHSMHHRAQVLYLLRLTGVNPLPEGDVFSWENRADAHDEERP